MFSSYKKYYRSLYFIISLFILFGYLSIPYRDAKAAEPWVKIVGSSNGIQEAETIGDTIVQKGTHNNADDDVIRYRTQFYYMTRETYDLNQKFSVGTNESIEKKVVPFVFGDERDMGGTLKVEYIIKMKDFMKAAAELDITGDYIVQNGSATVYLNNVFDSYLGNKIRKNDIYGYQEMLNAESWSSDTRTFLRGYYNYKYVISNSSVFNVKIIAVDEQGNVLNTDLLGHPKKAIYNEVIPVNKNTAYKLPNNMFSITKNGITYTYDRWEYDYKDRSTEKDKTIGSFTGTSVSFNAPDAYPGSTLTIKMVYKPAKGSPYKVKVVAEPDSGTHIKDLQSERETYGGASFNYNMPENQKFLNSKYTYQNKFKLTYTSPDGTLKTSPIVNEVNIKNYTMPAAKKDSTAVFHMIYSTSSAPTPTPTPKPDVFIPPDITPPPSDSHQMEFTTPVNTGVILADNRGAEKFTAVQGVPTTESLYGRVTAKDYLVGYSFIKKTGVRSYPITVSKNYNLSWMTATPISAGGPKPVSETVTVRQTITVTRAYAYWEIQNFECYKIGSAVLRNYALPNEEITIYPDYSYYHPPQISVRHSSDESYHIQPPNEYIYGITLPAENITSSGTSMPTFGGEDFTSAAWSMTGNISVKSDYLSFNGTTVISDSITQTIAPDINRNGVPQCETFINDNVFYKPNNIIKATKVNGTNASSGTITYTAIATVNPTRPVNPQYSIDGINKVIIHTPVVCNPSITDNNNKHSQLINPTEGYNQLVLDPDPTLSDFVVTISNTGPHSNKQGYYSRDFSRSLRDPNISYIAEDDGVLMNQVKFPFDVYLDKGVANDRKDDKFIKSHTWLTIGRTAPRFYLPMTVNEGVYTVQFRTVAVNGLPFFNQTEEYANKKLTNYVATNTINVEVSGRIYGLTIYDLTDYPIWEEVFRVKNSMDFKKDFSKFTPGTGLLSYSSNRSYTYTLGTNNQYGVDTGRNTKYTFPLVNGSHPYYKNMGILKTGYLIRFLLDTTGNMFSDSCKVSIKPKFYYVDKNGMNRVPVDLYYTESINKKTKHLVKVGSPLDQTNLKNVRTGDIYLGIPEAELKQTAELRGMTFSQFTAKSSPMFNFSEIRLNWAFRTYINNAYTNTVKGYDSFDDMKDIGIKESDLLERMQRWYGQYYIPNKVHIVEKDFDVMDYADKYGVDYSESFWKKDGYIIINFSIETIGEDGSRRLSYINAANYRDNGNCSMWLQEGPVQTKKNSDGVDFQFYAGDFIVYYNSKSVSQDYNSGVIY
jgi:hypothetical protein